jgi:glutamate-5-semialdehyde dehydrogenase
MRRTDAGEAIGRFRLDDSSTLHILMRRFKRAPHFTFQTALGNRMSLHSIQEIAAAAKRASHVAARLDGATKTALLREFASAIDAARADLQRANHRDLEAAERDGLPAAMRERLALSDKTLHDMIDSLREVADQPDPVGEMTRMTRRPNGLTVGRMRIPLGVVGVIYESRPNVTTDAAALCLKAGNAVILRGGSEAFHSNMALGETLQRTLARRDLPPALVSVVPSPDRETVSEMLKLDAYIDLIIPRGGEALIQFVARNSRIPVIQHYKGVCHTFIDATADPTMAAAIAVNAKAQRPGVCNATETLLIHQDAVATCLPHVARSLAEAGVEMRACPRAFAALQSIGLPPERLTAARDEDFGTEFLDLILAVRVVDDYDEAVAHIRRHGSSHTEAIVTQSHQTAMRFVNEVHSSVVTVNASTRFADGKQLGLGAEIGISTTKLHAFGPMGAEELTAEKFVVFGDGHVRT